MDIWTFTFFLRISSYLSTYWLGYLSFSYRFIGDLYLLDGTFSIIYVAVTFPGFFFFLIVTFYYEIV